MPKPPQRQAADLTYTKEVNRKGGRQVTAIDNGRIVGHLSTRPGAEDARGRPASQSMGEELSLGYVAPSHQRQGVATTMLNLMKHDLGYTPVNDTALTPKAKKWAAKVGIPDNPKPALGYKWGAGAEEEIAETIQGKQAHMLHAEQFDPEVVRQRAHYSTKAPRRKKAVQGELFSAAEVPTYRTRLEEMK